MARDKARDDKYFNCAQESEHEYVAGLYPKEQRATVREFLKEACADNSIKYSSHLEVYELIAEELGYEIPE